MFDDFMKQIFFSFRASDDLKKHMVVADSMEQFQKDLDQGKVSKFWLGKVNVDFWLKLTHIYFPSDCTDSLLWRH